MITTELEAKVQELNTQIKELSDRRASLNTMLHEQRVAEDNARFESWDVTDDDVLICFAKVASSTSLIKTIKINKIYKEKAYFTTVIGDYYKDLEDVTSTWYKCEHNWISFSSLKDLETQYNIYVADAVQLASLQVKMSELAINAYNIDVYETIFKEHWRKINS